jgi:hypothetical protein
VNAGLSYGALAFAAGGLLGPLREIVLAERIGGPAAAMAELAMMALLLWLAARWVVGRLPVPSLRARALVAGIGLALVLACDVVLGLLLDASGLTGGRAPRGLEVQLVGLALLAWLVAMPFVVHRRTVAAPQSGPRSGGNS